MLRCSVVGCRRYAGAACIRAVAQRGCDPASQVACALVKQKHSVLESFCLQLYSVQMLPLQLLALHVTGVPLTLPESYSVLEQDVLSKLTEQCACDTARPC